LLPDCCCYVGSYKISPKPCRVNDDQMEDVSLTSASGSSEGICMFVWECLKSDGKHLGMCVDGFMFGSCCFHNSTANHILPVPAVVDSTTVGSGSSSIEQVGVESISHAPSNVDPQVINVADSLSLSEEEEQEQIPFITKLKLTTSTTTTSTTTSTTTEKPTTTTTPTPPTQRPTSSRPSTVYINPSLVSVTTESPSLFENISSVPQFERGCGVAPLMPQKRIVGGMEGNSANNYFHDNRVFHGN